MKYALVTGGSRGIGRAVCVKLASQGYHILINYRSNDAEASITQELTNALGVKSELLKFDVSNKVEVDRVLGGWIELNKDKAIEVLINNAGIRDDALMVFMEEDKWKKVLDCSLNGFYYVTRLVVHGMISKRYGRIVNVVSLSGIKGMPGQTNYSAAKGGIIAATKALALEVAKRGITVNAVAPGFIHTDMTQDLNEQELKMLVPMQRFGEPEEVADTIEFLTSSKASYITGSVISVNGGLYT